MKRLTFAALVLPTAALAHGAHPPVPEEVHGLAHGVPVLVILGVIIAAVILWRGTRS